ncbi:MAG: hypothetical protein AAFV88_25630, partial [Planctomycetota bacterium]
MSRPLAYWSAYQEASLARLLALRCGKKDSLTAGSKLHSTNRLPFDWRLAWNRFSSLMQSEPNALTDS